LAGYSRHHPELLSSTFVIPQLPGSLRRSESVEGVLEAILKKYVVPLALIQPAAEGVVAAAYLADGRSQPRRNAPVFNVASAAPPQPAGTGMAAALPIAPLRLCQPGSLQCAK
jgi:hypothetical protein